MRPDGSAVIAAPERKLSTTIILMVEIILLLSSIVFCAVSISRARIGIRKSIQQRMLDIANCASGSVNGDILENLTAEDAGTPEFQTIYDALAVFRDNVELEFVYGIRDEGNGSFTFTVDPALEDAAPFGSDVVVTQALVTASHGTAAVDEDPYTDAWGSFYSAYSPVFDSSGKVAGIIATDFSVEWFDSQLMEQTRSTVISYFLILLLTLLIAGVLALVTIRPYMRMQEELEQQVREKQAQMTLLSVHSVEALSAAIDAKDAYTNGHSGRVAKYAREIARRIGYSKEDQERIYMLGLLHDVGKIGIPDAVINKPGPLTEKEFEQIKTHSILGARILETIHEMPELVTGAKYHHERYDGIGYPEGLAGKSIPEMARIIGVADAYDAMSSNRSYRNALAQTVVRKEIEDGKGTQFDPVFADIMLQMIDEDSEYQMRGQ